MPRPKSDSAYATVREVAERYRVHRSLLYEMTRGNRCPGMRRLGRAIRINLAEFEAAARRGELGIL